MKNPGQDLPSTLVGRAQHDAAFRRDLMANPKAALRSAGARLPDGVELKVVEETPTRWYLVLPTIPAGEIADEQLDRVAGGLAYPTGLATLGAAIAGGGVPGVPQVAGGGVPGTPRPLGPVSGGGVPGAPRPIGPVSGGGVPG